jgi:hypothetical protein
MTIRFDRRRLIAVSTIVLGACGSGSGLGASKPIGSAGGPCTGGGGCDPGLVCQSQICAYQTDSGAPKWPDSGSIRPTSCSTSGLAGSGIPVGTVASANASSSVSPPSNAIDGSLATAWNSGSYSGWLRLDFPAPVTMTGVHILAAAKPTADETFSIAANGSTTLIGSATRQVTAGVLGAQLSPIPVTPGTYASITISVNGGLSWVQIMEIALVTSDCPVECGCTTRLCGDDGCGLSCGTCNPGETCIAGDCVS